MIYNIVGFVFGVILIAIVVARKSSAEPWRLKLEEELQAIVDRCVGSGVRVCVMNSYLAPRTFVVRLESSSPDAKGRAESLLYDVLSLVKARIEAS